MRIRFTNGTFYRREFARGSEQLEIEVNGPLAVADMPLMIDAAERGLGLAYVYVQYAAAPGTAGRLLTVLDDWCLEIPGFYLYSRAAS
jgi:DNA-binding transcriptional LysR family regulator